MTDPLEVLRDGAPVLRWEPMCDDDIEDVARLIAAVEHIDDTIERHTLDDLVRLVEVCDTPLDQIAVVGRDQRGTIVAYAFDAVHPRDRSPRRVKLLGNVHPGWRDKRIGHALVQWQIAAARRWDYATRKAHHGPLKLTATADANLTGVRELYEAYGMNPETWYLDAHRTFDPDDPPHLPGSPDGVWLRPYLTVHPESVRVAHNEAWLSHPGATSVGPAEWDQTMTRPGSMPELSWVLMAGRRVVGYALNSIVGSVDEGTAEGWTDRLGVVPAWRGRGLSGILLQASAAAFFQHGLPGAGIGFDSNDPLTDLARYRGLGYDTIDAVVAHARVMS